MTFLPTWHPQLFQFVLNFSPSTLHMKNSTDLNHCEAICILIISDFPDTGLISTCIHFHNDTRVKACTTKPQCKVCPLITYARFGFDIKTCRKEEPRRNTNTCDEYAESGQLNRSTKNPGFLDIETKGEKNIEKEKWS